MKTATAPAASRPWMAVGVALAAAGLLVAAHPPFGAEFLAPLVPAVFLAALRLAPGHGARTGALIGFLGHLVLLQWIAQPAGVVAWILLSAIQGGWWALLGASVAPWLDRRWILLAMPVAWVGVDVARLTVPLGGFLWGDLASATVDWTWLHPLIRVGGAQAATLALVAIGTAVWFVGDRVIPVLRGEESGEEAIHRGNAAAQPGLMVLVGTALVVTLATVGPPPTSGTLDVLVVQANDVEDWFRTAADLDVAIAQRQLAATREALGDGDLPDVVIWPESSIDRDPARDATIADIVAAAAALTDGRLLAGVNLDGDESRTFFNALARFDRDGAILERYAKRNLVPFGEYIPFRDALDWFPPLQQVPRDGVPGDGPQSLEIGGAVIAPTICFETMKSRTVRSNIRAGDTDAGLIVTATNDASFGRTGEPRQHLAQARLRAVETGRWVVYGAVSGPSALVTAEGEVQEATDLFTRATIRRDIPLAAGSTPFLVTGDIVGPLSVIGLLALILLRFQRRRQQGGT